MRPMHILGILLTVLGWAGCSSTNAAVIDGGMDAGVSDVARCTDTDCPNPPPPPPTCNSCCPTCPTCPPPTVCPPPPPPRPPLKACGTMGGSLGNLPVTRTVALTPGDPVPSNVINELQDRDIASNGPRDIYISGAEFCDDLVGSGTAVYGTGGIWTLGDRHIRAPLVLPVGSTILDVRISVNSTSGHFPLARIQRRSFGDGGALFDGDAITSGTKPAAGSWGISSQGGSSVILGGFIYTIMLQTGGGAGTTLFDGVKLTIQDP